MILFFGLFALNVAISYYNARALGLAWNEMAHAGTGMRVLAWCSAFMPAAGFTYSYLTVLVFIALALHKLTLAAATAAFDLGYVLLIPGVLVMGLVFTLQSWVRLTRERTLANAGVAGFNTAAQIYNTVNAARDFMPAVGNAFGFLTNGRNKNQSALVLALVALALCGGILTTGMLIRYYADRAAARARAAMTPVTIQTGHMTRDTQGRITWVGDAPPWTL